MINISKLKEYSHKTKVEASNNIFDELGKNTYDYKDLISELIDNAIAARYNDRTLSVVIDIYVDRNSNPAGPTFIFSWCLCRGVVEKHRV